MCGFGRPSWAICREAGRMRRMAISRRRLAVRRRSPWTLAGCSLVKAKARVRARTKARRRARARTRELRLDLLGWSAFNAVVITLFVDALTARLVALRARRCLLRLRPRVAAKVLLLLRRSRKVLLLLRRSLSSRGTAASAGDSGTRRRIVGCCLS